MRCHRTLSLAFWLSGGRAMIRWEYHFIQVTNAPFLHSGTVPDFVNELGGDGWELVGFDLRNQARRAAIKWQGLVPPQPSARHWPFQTPPGPHMAESRSDLALRLARDRVSETSPQLLKHLIYRS